MKTTVFALAALLASSGLALAGAATSTPETAACTAAQVKSGKVDCAPTGSIARPSVDDAKDVGKPKLGYDGSPWIVPSFN